MRMKNVVRRIGMLSVFALITAMLFTACKPDFPIDVPNDNPPEAESEVQSEENEPESETEVSGTIENAQFSVDVKKTNLYDYEDMMYAKAGYEQLVLDENAPEKLAYEIAAWNEAQRELIEADFENIKDCARTDYADNAEYFFGPYETFSNIYIKRVDSKVLSVEEDYYYFSGGIHGSSTYGGYTWDVSTGEILNLEDVITDVDSLPEILAEKFTLKYPDVTIFADSIEDVFAEYLKPDRAIDFTWTLEHDGIVFYFGHYEIASYADGLQQLKILFAEKPELFNEKYFAQDSQKTITEFSPSDGVDVDVDGDYVTENVSVLCFADSAEEPYFSYSVYFDGIVFEQECYIYEINTYLVRNNGRNYIYVEKMQDNDYRSFDVYSIQKGSLEQVGCFDGGLNGFTNPDSFRIQTRADLLGTHSLERKCTIGEDGTLEYLEEDYTVMGGSVVSKKEFEVTALDAEGNQDGPVTYPVGTEFFFDRTDAETYMILKLADGTKCYVTITPGWPPTVNGYDAQECFEELLYAG